MPKQRTARRGKRRFSGNQFTTVRGKKVEKDVNVDINEEPCDSSDAVDTPADTPEGVQHSPSVSAKKLSSSSGVGEEKLKESSEYGNDFSASSITGFRMVDMEILSGMISSLRCADCGCFTLSLMENTFDRKGCASMLRIFCNNCGWKTEEYSSKKQTQSFEVNRRLVYAMRSLGKGHSGAKKFCILMNMPPPSAAKPFSKSSRTIAIGP